MLQRHLSNALALASIWSTNRGRAFAVFPPLTLAPLGSSLLPTPFQTLLNPTRLPRTQTCEQGCGLGEYGHGWSDADTSKQVGGARRHKLPTAVWQRLPPVAIGRGESGEGARGDDR